MGNKLETATTLLTDTMVTIQNQLSQLLPDSKPKGEKSLKIQEKDGKVENGAKMTKGRNPRRNKQDTKDDIVYEKRGSSSGMKLKEKSKIADRSLAFEGISLLTFGCGCTLTSSVCLSLVCFSLMCISLTSLDVPADKITLAVLKEVVGSAMGVRNSLSSVDSSYRSESLSTSC
ncbi:hypothetical protein ACR2XN_28850 [Klebsiella pneumoniae]